MTERERELLLRHRPLLRYDRQFDFRASSAATITDNACNLLARDDGSAIARPPRLTLDRLAAYPPPLEPSRADRLVQGPDRLGDARRFDADERYADRAYARVVEDGGRTWLQYWLFYYDNPKHLLGFGRHEGDWELVQVGLGAGGEPEVVTCCQHSSAEPRDWAEVERRDGHPVIYVAPLSHASYFEARTHPYVIGIDHPFGDGPEALPELEEFGPWVEWPGRWGASRARIASLGNSPRGPFHQGDRWRRPAVLHSRSARRRLSLAVGDVIHRVGRLTYPPAPRIAVRLEGEMVLVDWELPRTALRRPRHLYLTVHVEEGRERVLASRVVEHAGRAGSEPVPLPETPARAVVWASAFNGFRQRSDLTRADAVRAG